MGERGGTFGTMVKDPLDFARGPVWEWIAEWLGERPSTSPRLRSGTGSGTCFGSTFLVCSGSGDVKEL
ncbi:MAG: hypothetical protein FMNOHCHN_02257 [Ignavibacteriaceae bacterium]|nr:hypothetical protein [Ignavibacteriaceae bacterium]